MDNNVKIRIIGSVVVVLFILAISPLLLSPKDKGLLHDVTNQQGTTESVKDNPSPNKLKNQPSDSEKSVADGSNLGNHNNSNNIKSQKEKDSFTKPIELSSINVTIKPQNQLVLNKADSEKKPSNNISNTNKDKTNPSITTGTDQKKSDKAEKKPIQNSTKKPVIVLASLDDANKTVDYNSFKKQSQQIKNPEMANESKADNNKTNDKLQRTNTTNLVSDVQASSKGQKYENLSTKPAWLRVASLTEKTNAKKLADKLQKEKLKTKLSTVTIEEINYERVLVGPITSKPEFDRVLKVLSNMGYSPIVQE